MLKKLGIFFMITGAVLSLSALLLFVFNCYKKSSSGQEAEILLEEVISVIEERESPALTASEEESEIREATLSDEFPVAEINGYEYIGYLSIPSLELDLPVMAEWDYTRLEIAPCRQFGFSKADSLVIAAHNYRTHFGKLSTLEIGSEVYFTDMDGFENRYKVQSVSTLSPDAVDAVQNSGHALVLYTCTYEGLNRVAVFCD